MTWKTGRAVKDGISACIAGKPNVGKPAECPFGL